MRCTVLRCYVVVVQLGMPFKSADAMHIFYTKTSCRINACHNICSVSCVCDKIFPENKESSVCLCMCHSVYGCNPWTVYDDDFFFNGVWRWWWDFTFDRALNELRIWKIGQNCLKPMFVTTIRWLKLKRIWWHLFFFLLLLFSVWMAV